MTRAQALRILIERTIDDCCGSRYGCGIRTVPSQAEKIIAVEAILKLHKSAYGYDITRADACHKVECYDYTNAIPRGKSDPAS